MILKTKVQKTHLLLGILVLVGIYFLVADFNFENRYFQAIGIGTISSICYSIRNIIAKVKITNHNDSMIMPYQLVIITIMLSPILFLLNVKNTITEWPNVLLLGLLTTALGHTLFLISFKKFSITTTSILSSSGPIIGIIL